MSFLASVIGEARKIRFGTGVVNLPHHNPIIVAAEAAMFDHLCGGRLMLGIGPGGLFSDAALFGHEDIDERYRMTLKALDIIVELWRTQVPFRIEGDFRKIGLETQVWPYGGIGRLSRPLQEPHPPIAMAVTGPGGRRTAEIAMRSTTPRRHCRSTSAIYAACGGSRSYANSASNDTGRARRHARRRPDDRVGRLGRLIMVGHDWEATGMWQSSMKRLAFEVMPKLSQHASAMAD